MPMQQQIDMMMLMLALPRCSKHCAQRPMYFGQYVIRFTHGLITAC
jgi:hypothetical protein